MVEEKILVVDDNEEILDKTKDLLQRVGYSVECCNSGKDALDYLSENKVDLVLLDINMPSTIFRSSSLRTAKIAIA